MSYQTLQKFTESCQHLLKKLKHFLKCSKWYQIAQNCLNYDKKNLMNNNNVIPIQGCS